MMCINKTKYFDDFTSVIDTVKHDTEDEIIKAY